MGSWAVQRHKSASATRSRAEIWRDARLHWADRAEDGCSNTREDTEAQGGRSRSSREETAAEAGDGNAAGRGRGESEGRRAKGEGEDGDGGSGNEGKRRITYLLLRTPNPPRFLLEPVRACRTGGEATGGYRSVPGACLGCRGTGSTMLIEASVHSAIPV